MINAKDMLGRINEFENANYSLGALSETIDIETGIFIEECFPEVEDFYEKAVIRHILLRKIMNR